MGRNKYYQYFVEGDDDKKIIDTLKTEMQLIIPGKVQKFNVIEKLLNNNHIMSLKEETHVVLVFDIDTPEKFLDILYEEWHPTKNGNRKLNDFTPGSTIKVWWKCSKCGNEFNCSIKTRKNGGGCSVCGIKNLVWQNIKRFEILTRV